jgi:hypothetical protein
VAIGSKELTDGIDDICGGHRVLLLGQHDHAGFATVTGGVGRIGERHVGGDERAGVNRQWCRSRI